MSLKKKNTLLIIPFIFPHMTHWGSLDSNLNPLPFQYLLRKVCGCSTSVISPRGAVILMGITVKGYLVNVSCGSQCLVIIDGLLVVEEIIVRDGLLGLHS